MERTNIFFVVAVLVLCGCSKREGSTKMGEPNVRELVKLFQRGAGSDDVAGDQLRKMGTRGRDKLITLLDDPASPQEESATIVMILHLYFPCRESKEAFERFASRIEDPKEKGVLVKMIQQMTTDPRYK